MIKCRPVSITIYHSSQRCLTWACEGRIRADSRSADAQPTVSPNGVIPQLESFSTSSASNNENGDVFCDGIILKASGQQWSQCIEIFNYWYQRVSENQNISFNVHLTYE